jgi:RecA-superfamily ATPases implicated in signal transduction
MAIQIRKAERRKAKARVGLVGPSGSGKTLSALLIAYGIAGDWEKIGMIDTEQHSGDLYANTTKAGVHIGEFLKVDLEPPYTPDKYIEAIKAFEDYGVEVIIIDSLSHAWAGEGGLLDLHGKVAAKVGNSFTAWRDVTPKHNQLVDAMLKSKCHIIATMRAKQEYVVDKDEKGKTTVRKVGLAPIQRDGMEYEFTTVFDLSHDHTASASKDRSGLFDGQYFTPTVETGKVLKSWLESGAEPPTEQARPAQVQSATVERLKRLWVERGYKPAALEVQLQKLYGVGLDGVTDEQAQDLINKLQAQAAG